MTTLTLEQAYEACQNNKSAWLNLKAELAATEEEYRNSFRRIPNIPPVVFRYCATH
jgi:hypothetical protein